MLYLLTKILVYLLTITPEAISANAKTKIKNFVGKHNANKSPAAKDENARPAHLPFEYICNTPFFVSVTVYVSG